MGYVPFVEKPFVVALLFVVIEAGDSAKSRTFLHFRRFTRRGLKEKTNIKDGRAIVRILVLHRPGT